MIGFFVPLFYLPDMVKLNGVDDDNKASFLISIYGKYIIDYFKNMTKLNLSENKSL